MGRPAEKVMFVSPYNYRAVYNYDLFSFDVQHTKLPSLHFLLLWIRHKNVSAINNCDYSGICKTS